MTATKQARAELSTTRLLDAAAQLITEVGYDRATLAAIGERAGYSHGLVTRRFGSKERLLAVLIDRMTVTWDEQRLQPSLDGLSGLDTVLGMIEAIRTSIERSPREMKALYHLMFEALRPIPVLEQRMRQLHRHMRKYIGESLRRGIADGSVATGTDPDAMARLMVATLRGAVYQWLLDAPRFDIDGTLSDLRHHLEATLRATRRDRP